MKINRILTSVCVLVLAVLLTPALSSCGGEPRDKYKMPDLEDGVYAISEDISHIYPYDGKIYVAKNGNEVGYYDSGFKTYTKLRGDLGQEMWRLCVNEKGIFAASCDTVYHMDFDGSIKKTYKIPELEGENYYTFIAASEDYIAVASTRKTSNEIYMVFMTADMNDKNAELEIIGEKYTDDYFIRSFVPGEDSEFYIATQDDTVKLDVKSGRCEPVFAQKKRFAAIDYLPGEDCLHAEYTRGYVMKFVEIPFDTESVNITRSIPFYRMYVDVKQAVMRVSDRELSRFNIDADTCMAYTGYDYIIFDKDNDVVHVSSPYVNTTGETLNIIGHTDKDPINGLYPTYISNNNDLLNAKFEDDENVRVSYKVYDYESFATKLRLDMMSGSDEYDIVMLDYAPDFLAGILKYQLYLPLETYPAITGGFKRYIDGVQDVMTYDGHIYGVPKRLSANSFYSEKEPTLSPDYTFDEFKSLYQNGIKIEGKLMYSLRLFQDLIKSVIEDGVEKGEISRDAIVECLELLDRSENPGGEVYAVQEGIGGTIYTDSFVEDAKGESFTSARYLRPIPSYNDKNYIDVEAMTYINSAAKSPDLAAKYLANMVSEKFIGMTGRYEKSFIVKYDFKDLYGSHEPSLLPPYENPLDYGYELRVYPLIYGMSSQDTFLLKNGGDLFTNAYPRIYTYALDDLLKEIYDGLYRYDPEEGRPLTLEGAADEIYRQAKYQLME